MRRSKCPECGSDAGFTKKEMNQSFDVRGEPITVQWNDDICVNCGEPLEGDQDPLDLAYRQYRKNHEMVQPEAIQKWREDMKLTQKELAGLLEFGAVTLSRYENGALQAANHNKQLADIMTKPSCLLEALEKNPEALSAEKRERLRESLQQPLLAEKIRQYVTTVATRIKDPSLTGGRAFDLNRASAMCWILAGTGEFKTKLNKLFFYADFGAYRERLLSISALPYARATHGPVPDKYDPIFDAMEQLGVLEKELVETDNFSGDYLIASKNKPDMCVLTEHEIELLEHIKSFFSGWSAGRIRDYSHKERAWLEHANGSHIAYHYAFSLRTDSALFQDRPPAKPHE